MKKGLHKSKKMCYDNPRWEFSKQYGPVAQLGERTVRIRKVVGSNPFRSTRLCCQKMQHRKTLHESAVFSCFIRRFQLEKLRKMQFPNNWQPLTRGAQKRCRRPIFSTEVIRTPRLSKKRTKQAAALPFPHVREGRAAFFRLWILRLRLRDFFVDFCEWLSVRRCGMVSVPGNARKRRKRQ